MITSYYGYSEIEKYYARNVVLNLDGTISSLPFDGKRNGLWRTDGQFYWLDIMVKV